MLETQRLLRSGVTPDVIKERYNIDYKLHPYPECSGWRLFKYGLDSPFSERIVRECRGLILDANYDWKIISYPWDKFFNSHEGYAASIDWPTAKVQDKCDGTACILFYYQTWHIQTLGTPDAGGQVNGHPFTFRELFWNTFCDLKLKVPSNDRLCIFFELTSKYNSPVVRHDKPNLTVLGGRDLDTLKEITAEEAAEQVGGIPVRSFQMHTIEDVVFAAKALNGSESEGFVVVDAVFNRIKVKSPDYVAKHQLKDGWSPRRALELILTGEAEEVISYFPEWADDIHNLSRKLIALEMEIGRLWAETRDIVPIKDFALKVKSVPYYDALFSLKKEKVTTVREWIKNQRAETLMELING